MSHERSELAHARPGHWGSGHVVVRSVGETRWKREEESVVEQVAELRKRVLALEAERESDERLVKEEIMRTMFAAIKEKGGVNPEDFAFDHGFKLRLVYEVADIFRARGWLA